VDFVWSTGTISTTTHVRVGKRTQTPGYPLSYPPMAGAAKSRYRITFCDPRGSYARLHRAYYND
jgi:hypothetical protein